MQIGLDRFLEDFVHDIEEWPFRIDRDAQMFGRRNRFVLILKDGRVEIVHLQNRLMIRPAAPRRCQRDLLALIVDDRLAEDLLRQRGDEFFREDDQVLIVGIGQVEFQHRKFWVMNRRDPFVPEVAIDFEYARKAAHDQPFQIEFRRNTEIKIDA